MGQERMSGLVFLHINHGVYINKDEVIDRFARKKNRALTFLNICIGKFQNDTKRTPLKYLQLRLWYVINNITTI